MGWKKIADSKDLVIYEKRHKNHRIKIEARKNPDERWEVFHIQLRGEDSHVLAEYVFPTRQEALKTIAELQAGKKPEIRQANKPISISLKRIYKEDFVEKWFFQIDKEEPRNFVLAKFDSKIYVDVVINEKYRLYENRIITQLEDKLGFGDLADAVRYDIYYYSKSKSIRNYTEHTDDGQPADVEFDFYSEDE